MSYNIMKYFRIIAVILALLCCFSACYEGDGGQDTVKETDTIAKTDTTAELDTMPDTDTDAQSDTPDESDAMTETETPTDPETETEPETVTEPDTTEKTDTTTESDTATESETTIEQESEENTVSEIYENGESVKDAGIKWTDKAFALTENVIDESKAIDISADELKALLTDKKALTGDEVYRVTEPLVLDSDTKYYGNFASVIAEGGVVIKNASAIVVKELIVKGDLTIEGSSDITFFKLDLQSGAVAVTIDSDSANISFKSCKLSATDIAVRAEASGVSFFQNYISAETAISSVGDGLVVQNSHIVSVLAGVLADGKDCIVRDNTIELSSNGIGVQLGGNSENALVALNVIKDAQMSISIEEGYNCAVIMNSAIVVRGINCTNLYIVDNSLGGRIEVEGNKYLICDGNKYVRDIKDHSIVSVGNSEVNGDGLTDINARVEYGANDDVLPHTNKDLFSGMQRNQTVVDCSLTKKYNISTYVRTMAENSTVVIVPPGAYSTSTAIMMQGNHSNTTVYAYGVLCESDVLDNLVYLSSVSNVKVKGITLAYTHQSAGQVHVLDKLGDNRLLVVTNAGYINDFGRSDSSVFANVYFDVFYKDSGTPWLDGGCRDYTVTHNDDGTMIIQMTDSNAAKIYHTISKGDVLACRLAGSNKRSIFIGASHGVTFKDCVLYGYTAALAIVSTTGSYDVTLERFHNTSSAGAVIDKETYDRYTALEHTYDVDLGVYEDSRGEYRGGAAKFGSVDGAHVIGVKQGINATSSIFENMCDDGANQRGDSSRLAGIRDNGDGTVSVFIKGNLTEEYFKIHSSTPTVSKTPYGIVVPKNGDRLYAYTASGKTIFDTNAIGDAVIAKSTDMHLAHVDSNGDGKCDVDGVTIDEARHGLNTQFYSESGQIRFQIKNESGKITVSYADYIYEVKVKIDAVDLDALEGFDPLCNGYAYEDKIIVDNLSANSSNFTYDNVLIQNTRMRGIVAKAVGVTLRSCTFRNISCAGVLLAPEPAWGEGTVPRDIIIEGCLFDNTGNYERTQSQLKKACIAVMGVGDISSDVTVSKDTLPCSNIKIIGNKFTNINNNYAIVLNAVQGVVVKNNVFTERDDESASRVGKAIYVNGCMDIDVSGNTYSKFADGDMTKVITAINYAGLTGDDVSVAFPEEDLK